MLDAVITNKNAPYTISPAMTGPYPLNILKKDPHWQTLKKQRLILSRAINKDDDVPKNMKFLQKVRKLRRFTEDGWKDKDDNSP